MTQATRMRASEMKSRCSMALNSTNISKNRYTDVLPFDNNRVVLDPPARGYINASFIKISEDVSQFIATQGPLQHTFEDFWEMIIQHRCPVIVMLTQLFDNYKVFNCLNYQVSIVMLTRQDILVLSSDRKKKIEIFCDKASDPKFAT
uniref:Protein tyrosine phosphatase n=1 Tax=Solanum tuberosum TaxID=4113 RepID=M1CA20_SOLTU